MASSILTPDALDYMVTPGVVESFWRLGEQREAHEAIQSQRNVYCDLPEVRDYRLMMVSHIENIVGRYYFWVTGKSVYWRFKKAAEHDLSWSLTTGSVDYGETIHRWEKMLNRSHIHKSEIDIIRKNDLQDPRFKGFGVTLMEMILGSKSDQDFYYPQ